MLIHLLESHCTNLHTFLFSTSTVQVISELLHHWVEQFSSFQLVFAGSAPSTRWGSSMKQANVGWQGFPQLLVQMFNLTPLESLKLRDLFHVSRKKTLAQGGSPS